ncbi:MAG: histidine kinase N-terminal 7TM domain-containing protein, partial [Acidobacteriota bacterium]
MYLGLLAVAGVTSAVLAANAWRNRRYPGFAYFAAMELAAAWWILCYLGEQLDPERSLVWFALKFPAIGVIPPSWMLFALCQTGRRPRSRAWALAYLWPAVLLPLAVTNDGHRLLFSEIVQGAELVGVNGPLFPVHVIIGYVFFVAAAGLLL